MEDYEIIAKAQELYLQGSTKTAIGEQLNMHRKVVEAWSKRFGWDKIRDKLRDNVKKKVQQSQEEVQNRLLTIYRNFQIKGHDLVMSGEEKITPQVALKAAEQEAKMMGLDVQRIQLEETASINQQNQEMREKLKKFTPEEKRKFADLIWGEDE